MNTSILIVDDNVKWCKSLAQNFEPRGYHVFSATNGQEARGIMSTHPIHVVLLDIMLGEENGLELLDEFLLLHKNLPVIMITGFGSIGTAVQSLKLGAFDYVTKPLDFETLLGSVEKAIRLSQRSEQNHHRNDRPGEPFPSLITQNENMLELCERVRKFARTDFPILIFGENGTGKEVIADFIHANSARSSYKMLKINCASFPETLLDNELFGHEKGAYTGADAVFKGVFERAGQSSLFLDEIGDMPLTIQAKILRTLQNQEIRRLGGPQTITVDVRFLAATNKDLRKLIREKAFREDLFYRLEVTTIQVPPLRERRDDIPLLAEYFLSEYRKKNSTRAQDISDAVVTTFSQYEWPGNVRELRNTLRYAATITTGETILVDDLPPRFRQIYPQKRVTNIREDMERNLIVKTLQKTGYNKKKTAELLNMSRTTLYNKLGKYGISLPK
ncbi:MAG: sigma-54-dependent Fis family transcriptional regulator [bacterium]|nr:sigma-54-dependent Fis family transcriptional regulator [bacterium]